MKHLDIRIHGRVQGIFFRHSASELANYLGLKGFVRNEDDGSLYIEVEGEEKNLHKFLEWSRHGPPLAAVEKIEHSLSDSLKNFEDFKIA